jgi:protein required for attachment to host cells
MTTNLGKKLIAIVDKENVICYEALGVKIKHKLSQTKIDNPKHQVQNKHQGLFHKNSEMGGFFDPHTDPKDLENRYSAKNIITRIEEVLKEGEYKEVILSSSPKILGNIRKQMSKSLRNKVTKEIAKDLVHSDIGAIEKKVFA